MLSSFDGALPKQYSCWPLPHHRHRPGRCLLSPTAPPYQSPQRGRPLSTGLPYRAGSTVPGVPVCHLLLSLLILWLFSQLNRSVHNHEYFIFDRSINNCSPQRMLDQNRGEVAPAESHQLMSRTAATPSDLRSRKSMGPSPPTICLRRSPFRSKFFGCLTSYPALSVSQPYIICHCQLTISSSSLISRSSKFRSRDVFAAFSLTLFRVVPVKSVGFLQT